jgi:uncharacterized membrane protein
LRDYLWGSCRLLPPASPWQSCLAVAGGVLAILLPKCPVCLAAWIGVVGLGAFARNSIASRWALPLFIASLLVPLWMTSFRSRRMQTPALVWSIAVLLLVAAKYLELPPLAIWIIAISFPLASLAVWKREHVRPTIKH